MRCVLVLFDGSGVAPDTAWDRALKVQEMLSKHGLHRSVKVSDLIIVGVAEHHGVSVLHYDHEFDRIADLTGQVVEWLVPVGTA